MADRAAHKFAFGKKLLVSVAGFVAVALAVVFGLANAPLLRAQSPAADWQTAAGSKMAFDVASVKRNTSDSTGSTNIPLSPGDVYSPTGGLLSATNVPLIAYISFAFKVTSYQLQSLRSQLPKWVTADRYDIEARASGNPTKDQYRLMMQALLADRFRLSVHTESLQVPVFALVLIKPGETGPQLKVHSEDPPCAASAGTSETAAGGFPTACGQLAAMPPSASGRIRAGGRNVTMGVIASSFTGAGNGVDRPVLDMTGLTGKYDVIIEFTPELNRPLPPGSMSQPDELGPTFLEALKEQLGLKLESQTGPVDVLVVDHIEQPSEN